ncbi:hypothetical protein HK098_001276 [Nowakowskiella sp. JEL0407]|nr:hypothetical protein HK098_001276 [Nowakowskiella sp. JEL0407]
MSEIASEVKYILVLDFEATCSNDKSFGPQEIIEFPIVVVDLESNSVIAEFQEYVRPIRNPILDPFCTQLTGITQETVNAADTFPVVYSRVLSFLKENFLSPPHNSLFLTCGDWDLETMLPAQLRVSGIHASPEFSAWINIKVPFRNLFSVRSAGMTGMLSTLGLPLIGRHHSGIDDARNIAAIMKHLITLGSNMKYPTRKFTSIGVENVKVPQSTNREYLVTANSSTDDARGRNSKLKSRLQDNNKEKLNVAAIVNKEETHNLSSEALETEKVDSWAIHSPEIMTQTPLIDIGANLTHRHLFSDAAGIKRRARNANVSDIIITGISLRESEAAIDLCRTLKSSNGPRFWCTVGVHPHEAKRHTNATTIPRLRHLIETNRDVVVAVGECGLDFDRNFSSVEDQELVFRQQLELAKSLELPLFLHERSAHTRMVEIMRSVFPQNVHGVVHCFTSESKEELMSYLGMGLYIGITGWICDERRGKGLGELVSQIPLNRLMVETDAPFLMPRNIGNKKRPKHCEPYLVSYVVKKLAECYGIDKEEIARNSTINAKDMFKL